jgi:hypothetical protein
MHRSYANCAKAANLPPYFLPENQKQMIAESVLLFPGFCYRFHFK